MTNSHRLLTLYCGWVLRVDRARQKKREREAAIIKYPVLVRCSLVRSLIESLLTTASGAAKRQKWMGRVRDEITGEGTKESRLLNGTYISTHCYYSRFYNVIILTRNARLPPLWLMGSPWPMTDCLVTAQWLSCTGPASSGCRRASIVQ